ncbi:MAG: hypothetical protein IKR81_05625 [Victivallales bacterium]|nr:hypothetical protein [Victivallales bacterium]
MPKFLGIDCCTRKMNALVIDTDRRTLSPTVSVYYSDLRPQNEIKNGMVPNDDPLVKHSDPLVWADALDTLLGRLTEAGIDLSTISAISGCAQQHGTVYLSPDFAKNNWISGKTSSLSAAIAPMLTRKSSPIWMDSSTFQQCREIEAALGSAQYLQQKCGSCATERFAGPQIRKFFQEDSSAYAKTGVIHLVSSFLTSLLTGKSEKIDCCDAVGMNLMNIQTMDWDDELLKATAPGLRTKLPPICGNSHIAGKLHPYFSKYGLREVPVVTFTGDNPSSLIGIGGWKPGITIVALGTSDNIFAASDKPITDPYGYGHLFLNPAGKYMPLACFKNGTCAREHIMQEFNLTWHEFDVDAFDLTPPGNNGNILLPYVTDEITPQAMNVGGIVHEGNSLFKSHKNAASIVRAMVEAQAMTMRLHTTWFGNRIKSIRITGSMSDSLGVCQVLSDVFNTTVERLDHHNAAAQGAAMRAAQATLPDTLSWHAITKLFATPVSSKTISPNKQNVEIYKELIQDYAKLEKNITGVDCTLPN